MNRLLLPILLVISLILSLAAPAPMQTCTACGDANSDGVIDITDAVFLIHFIFSGGEAPGFCNYQYGKGDANGNGTVDISDAVFLALRIFTGGPPPHCFGM